MKKKVLTLTVSKQWFDMIADGRKNEEYRTIKGYWVKRLFLLWNEDTCTNEKIPTHCVKTGIVLAPKWLTIASIVHITRLFLTPTSSSSTATARIVHELRRRLIVLPSVSLKKVYVPTSGLIQSFLSLNLSDMNYIQCDECKYRLVCNGEPLTSGSTGS